MNLRSRLDRVEKKLPEPEIKISANVWDEDVTPWPTTADQKKAYAATRAGVKVIWIQPKGKIK